MAEKKKPRRGRPRGAEDTVMVARRLPVGLWGWFRAHCAAQRPKVDATALLVELLKRYRESVEGKGGRRE